VSYYDTWIKNQSIKELIMDLKNLLFETRDGIAYVTVNRPEAMNALNRDTIFEISKVFREIHSMEDVKGVILTGAGEKAFVAGADISELNKLEGVAGTGFSAHGHHTLHLIEDLSKPVIAAINGFALGGGCELAMACHIRLASENAKFGQPEVNLGLIPGFGGTQRLPRIVGIGRAMELILTGDIIDAVEAHRIGLVNRVTGSDDLIPESEKLLKKILSKGPLAVRFAIEAINHGTSMTLDEACRYEKHLFGLVCTSEDMREGTRAFLKKEKPDFKGR
jgi:enoyl-CoA hydratase